MANAPAGMTLTGRGDPAQIPSTGRLRQLLRGARRAGGARSDAHFVRRCASLAAGGHDRSRLVGSALRIRSGHCRTVTDARRPVVHRHWGCASWVRISARCADVGHDRARRSRIRREPLGRLAGNHRTHEERHDAGRRIEPISPSRSTISRSATTRRVDARTCPSCHCSASCSATRGRHCGRCSPPCSCCSRWPAPMSAVSSSYAVRHGRTILAIRLALGATRRHVVGEALAESTVLLAVSSLLGVLLAVGLVRAVRATAPGNISGHRRREHRSESSHVCRRHHRGVDCAVHARAPVSIAVSGCARAASTGRTIAGG